MFKIIVLILCIFFVESICFTTFLYSQVRCPELNDTSINKIDAANLKQGIWKYFYPDDCKLHVVEYYKDGKKNGIFSYYKHDGLLISEVPYVNDTIKGLAKYYYSWGPVICYEIEYNHGILNGETRNFSIKGKLLTKTNYSNGVKNGQEVTYYDNGCKMMETAYKNGKENGSRIIYNKGRSNRKIREYIFEDDIRVKTIYYKNSGKIKKITIP